MTAKTMAAMSHEVFTPHLEKLLLARQYPKTLCPSEVARALSTMELHVCEVSDWRELMPVIREYVWSKRADGQVEVLQRGEVLSKDIRLEDVKGPIRIRRCLA